MDDLIEEIDNWFTFHPPKGEDQIATYQELRGGGQGLAHLIASLVPPCTERDIAIEKLREAVMWANAGIACNS